MRTWRKVCLLSIRVSVPTGDNDAIYTPRSEPRGVQPASLLSRAAGQSHWGGPRLAPHVSTPGCSRQSQLSFWRRSVPMVSFTVISVTPLHGSDYLADTALLCGLSWQSFHFSDYSSAAIFASQEEYHVLEYWECLRPLF